MGAVRGKETIKVEGRDGEEEPRRTYRKGRRKEQLIRKEPEMEEEMNAERTEGSKMKHKKIRSRLKTREKERKND